MKALLEDVAVWKLPKEVVKADQGPALQIAAVAALAPTTRRAYRRVWEKFRMTLGKDEGWDELEMARYAARRATEAGVTGQPPRMTTITQELAGIRNIGEVRLGGMAKSGQDRSGMLGRTLRGLAALEKMTRPRLSTADGLVGRQAPPLGRRELERMSTYVESEDERTLWEECVVAYTAALRGVEHVAGALTWRRVRLDDEDGPHLVLGWTESEGGRTKTAAQAIAVLGVASERVDGAKVLRRRRARGGGVGAGEPVFVYGARRGAGRGVISHTEFNTRLRALAMKSGLPQAERFSAHSLRAGRATDMVRAGVPRDVIKKACRWLSDESVMRYERLAARELREASKTGGSGKK
jgi:Phage integrase family